VSYFSNSRLHSFVRIGHTYIVRFAGAGDSIKRRVAILVALRSRGKWFGDFRFEWRPKCRGRTGRVSSHSGVAAMYVQVLSNTIRKAGCFLLSVDGSCCYYLPRTTPPLANLRWTNAPVPLAFPAEVAGIRKTCFRGDFLDTQKRILEKMFRASHAYSHHELFWRKRGFRFEEMNEAPPRKADFACDFADWQILARLLAHDLDCCLDPSVHFQHFSSVRVWRGSCAQQRRLRGGSQRLCLVGTTRPIVLIISMFAANELLSGTLTARTMPP
jgi:hypothetical protein